MSAESCFCLFHVGNERPVLTPPTVVVPKINLRSLQVPIASDDPPADEEDARRRKKEDHAKRKLEKLEKETERQRRKLVKAAERRKVFLCLRRSVISMLCIFGQYILSIFSGKL